VSHVPESAKNISISLETGVVVESIDEDSDINERAGRGKHTCDAAAPVEATDPDWVLEVEAVRKRFCACT
jgi:hypothetical protein